MTLTVQRIICTTITFFLNKTRQLQKSSQSTDYNQIQYDNLSRHFAYFFFTVKQTNCPRLVSIFNNSNQPIFTWELMNYFFSKSQVCTTRKIHTKFILETLQQSDLQQDTYLTYWVQLNTLKANPAKKSRGLRNPATGRMRKPVFCWRNWETFSSCK